jgi:hypothetical protein
LLCKFDSDLGSAKSTLGVEALKNEELTSCFLLLKVIRVVTDKIIPMPISEISDRLLKNNGTKEGSKDPTVNCHLRIKSAQFLQDLKFKSAHLRKL